MGQAHLTIDLNAVVANWRALDRLSAPSVETAAVVKANGYGLDAGLVAQALHQAGARRFFVAIAEEGVAVRQAVGPNVPIHVFGGHMDTDTEDLQAHNLTPMLNSIEQLIRHFERLPGHGFGIQLDTGMNRLGMEPGEWESVAAIALEQNPILLMSHLACADEPDNPMNEAQRQSFHAMTDGLDVPRSLAATGGTLLGAPYHFDLTRPGVGLYGGAPFVDAAPVIEVDLPVIQVRDVEAGEAVGYGRAWIAQRPSRIATVSGGYADGLIRAMGGKLPLYAGSTACPIVGRVSMDLITVDVTNLTEVPATLGLITAHQGVDAVADAAGTIGYEILTSLGARYGRTYK